MSWNSKYTLSDLERLKFNILWREEIQFFKEVPWKNKEHAENAKNFAERVYALALENNNRKTTNSYE